MKDSNKRSSYNTRDIQNSHDLSKQEGKKGTKGYSFNKNAIACLGIATATSLLGTAEASPILYSSSLATHTENHHNSNFNPVVTAYQSHSLDTPKSSLSPIIENVISKIEDRRKYQQWQDDSKSTETLEPKSEVIQRLESVAGCLEKSEKAQKTLEDISKNPDAMKNIQDLMANEKFRECLASEIKNDASLKEAISLLETRDISSLLGDKRMMEVINHELHKRQDQDYPSSEEGLNKVRLIGAAITGGGLLCAIGSVLCCMMWKKKRQVNVETQNNDIALRNIQVN